MNMVTDQVWQDFLKIVREELGSRVVETWIKAVTFAHYNPVERQGVISAPNLFIKNWVEANYKTVFQKHLARLIGVDQLHLSFKIQQDVELHVLHQEAVKVIPAQPLTDNKKKKSALAKKTNFIEESHFRCNPDYRFDTFQVSQDNQFAYASCQAVVDKIMTLYNPLLIYGATGLGKTHLLQAIYHGCMTGYPDKVIMYQTAERFIAEFVYAVRFDKINAFMQRYNQVDVFLFDDLHLIAKKEQSQEMFLQLFTVLYESGKQIVITSQALPRAIVGLSDRLKNRLEWGLIVDLGSVSFEKKIDIVIQKVFKHGVTISVDIAERIAQRSGNNIKELEGYVLRLVAYASLTNQSITHDLVIKVLGSCEPVAPVQIGSVDCLQIARVIEKHCRYSIDTLRSKDRSRAVSLVRHLAVYCMKQYTKASLRDIAQFLYRKDHTTIWHSIEKIEALMIHDDSVKNLLDVIEKEIARAS